jgi:cytochrome c-type biogenesis protein CcmH/NrfF
VRATVREYVVALRRSGRTSAEIVALVRARFGLRVTVEDVRRVR